MIYAVAFLLVAALAAGVMGATQRRRAVQPPVLYRLGIWDAFLLVALVCFVAAVLLASQL